VVILVVELSIAQQMQDWNMFANKIVAFAVLKILGHMNLATVLLMTTV